MFHTEVHLRAAGDWLDAAGSSGSSARERTQEGTSPCPPYVPGSSATLAGGPLAGIDELSD